MAAASNNAPRKSENVKAVIATGNDAILSKFSTVQFGYFDDAFVEHFAPSTTTKTQSRHRRQDPDDDDDPLEWNRRHDFGSFSQRSQIGHQQQYRHHPHTPKRMTKMTTAPPSMPSASSSVTTQPLIRRGTHARLCVIDRAISSFLSSSDQRKQVVIVGSGSDTNWMRLATSKKLAETMSSSTWYELDYSTVIQQKASRMKTCPLPMGWELSMSSSSEEDKEAQKTASTQTLQVSSNESFVANIQRKKNGEFLSLSSNCHLVGYDLSDSSDKLFDLLVARHAFQTDCPTLFVLECVQMYLPENISRQMLESISIHCPRALLVLYDPILQSDAFGQVFETNLRRAGVIDDSSTVLHVRTLSSQLDRLCSLGFDIAVGCHMMDAYMSVLTQEQRIRANRCEMLDEMEEFMLLMNHYCFVVAGTANILSWDIGRTFCSVGKNSLLGFIEGKSMVLSGSKHGSVRQKSIC